MIYITYYQAELDKLNTASPNKEPEKFFFGFFSIS
jgi:hypothetical protein